MSKKTGFLVGALVGAAAALFLAPKKKEANSAKGLEKFMMI